MAAGLPKRRTFAALKDDLIRAPEQPQRPVHQSVRQLLIQTDVRA